MTLSVPDQKQSEQFALSPTLLEECSTRHTHLCPRQILGLRIGLLGGKLLGLPVPQENKRLLTLVETDGCASDGISVATGCSVGHRTLRVMDFGKVAATFVDTETERSFRVVPRPGIRDLAHVWMPDAKNSWQAQLQAYQVIPDADLLKAEAVRLTFSLEALLSKPGYRVNCAVCGEEILNEREVMVEGLVLCRACAGQSYYCCEDAAG